MPYAFSDMPEHRPMPMTRQDFASVPVQQAASHRNTPKDHAWRIAAFAPPLLLTFTLTFAIARWLSEGGVTALEAIVVILVAFTFIWVALSVTAVTLGAIAHARKTRPGSSASDRGAPQNVALLVPIYNEVTADVFGNALAMLHDLESGPQTDRFSLFIISDTQDAEIAAQEERAFWALKESTRGQVPVFYRRRRANTDKKVGNITDWVENWGAGYDAMLVMDADSLMSSAAICRLADELSADPDAGLIQSFPSVIGAHSLFGRLQQFSNAVYGWLLAEGFAVWSQREGNYWGHNAIIRLRAFADSAHLPYLRSWRGREDLILSHDFVEAGLMRRAGWGVRFLPLTRGSYEEAPQTLIDYALRDRRWCQGNLQHLRLLTARGFHPLSRFHLLQGAFAFLLSPAWLALLVIWSMVGSMPDQGAAYFSPSNPLYPIWPENAPVGGLLYLLMIYGMLLLPKVLGTVLLGLRPTTRAAYGGWTRFLATVCFEVGCSILYAPILMVQHSIAVMRAVFGLGKNGWVPQNRGTHGHGWATTLRFHAVEFCLGLGLVAGLVSGTTSLWLAPIALSLTLAPVLSKLSGARVSDRKLRFARLEAPQDIRVPRIVTNAQAGRAWIATRIEDTELPVAAE
ncbi:MAG: glucans biosynthesis glucosyltransferase MdoH [Pseudomonadota bacterium]